MELGLTATQEEVDMFNKQFGLNRPFFVRMYDYVTGIITRFDFGISYRGREPVMQAIIHKLPVTLTVAVFSVAGALLLAKGKAGRRRLLDEASFSELWISAWKCRCRR